MKITALAENTACSSKFGKEHGLSFYIEANGKKILFDMGQDGLFCENAKKRKLNISAIELAVLSHGHYDHGGGLPFFFEENESAEVWVQKQAFLPYYSGSGEEFHYIGLKKELEDHPRIRFAEGVMKLDENMTLFSGVTGRKCFSKSNLAMHRKEGDTYIRDSFSHEQSLLIREGDILVLFAGCAHNGILNILERAVEIAGRAPDYVFAGFHLSNPSKKTHESDEMILELAGELKKYPTRFYTGHCTGIYPYQVLKRELGAQVDAISSGRQWQLCYPYLPETEKWYYSDPYQTEFEANVLYRRKTKEGTEVILDGTFFYPEGGGQPWDTGYLDGIRVLEVHEKNGLVVHLLEGNAKVSGKISGKVDWNRRRDLMQQHSGEHMISGLIHQKYGYENVGFHLGKDTVTIDFNGMIPEEELEALEDDVNALIWKNAASVISYYTEEEVKELEYRSKKELHGTIRIVTFPEADVCACCGLHVTKTGEIGMLKIVDNQKIRQGSRLDIVCGERALLYLRRIAAENKKVSVLLSAKPEETSQAVQRLSDELLSLRQQYGELQNQWFLGLAKECAGETQVLRFVPGLDPGAVQRLTVAIMDVCPGICAVFSGDDENGYKYAVGQKGGDLRVFVKKMNASLTGRGGGKPFFAQGSVQASKAEIEQFFRIKAYRYLLFDLDGTLTEPKEGITRCVQYALHAFGIEEPDLDKLVPFIGPPLVDSFMKYYGMSEEDALLAVEKYRERFHKVGLFENKVIDGIPELLADLKKAGKVLAVATSKPEVYTNQILEKFDLMQYFDCVAGSELDGTRNAKSDVIQAVKDRLGIAGSEDEMLMIGDRCYDINGAKEQEIASAGVYFGYAEDGELEEAGADYVVSTVEELRDFLL